MIFLKKIKVESIYEMLAFFIMVLLILIIFIQVFSRRFLSTIPAWSTQETASLLLMWLVAIGASLAAAKNSHLAMNYLVDKLSNRLKKIVELGIYVFVTIFLVIVAIFSFDLAWANRSSTTPRLDISMFWLQISIFVGAVTMSGYYVVHLWHTIKMLTVKNKA